MQNSEGLPSHIRWDSQNNELKITYRWYRDVHVFMLVFGALWLLLLVFLYTNADEAEFAQDRFFFIFPFIHLVIGLMIVYYAFAGIFNRTEIRVSQKGLRVRQKPLFWLGNHRIRRELIEQLFVHEHISASQSGDHITYQVWGLLGKEKRKIVLLRGLESVEQAQFIEQKIESYLNITDYPVDGEYPKA